MRFRIRPQQQVTRYGQTILIVSFLAARDQNKGKRILTSVWPFYSPPTSCLALAVSTAE